MNPDCYHPNDPGHVLIGNAVFQAIATHCRGLGAKTQREIDQQAISTANTGGTDIDDEIRALWQAATARFELDQ